MKKVLIVLAQITLKLKLKFLWLPIYKALNSLVVFYLQGRGIDIWPRNSFTSGALTPPLSDLDYTIIYHEKNISKSEVLDKVNYIKKIVPLFREANVYPQQYLKEIAQFINPYELKRDPRLKEFLSRQNLMNQTIVKSHALVFIVKAFEHDIEYLSKYPRLRIARWKNLFSLIDQKLSPDHSLLENISWVICKFADMEEYQAKLIDFVQTGFDFNHSKSDIFSILFPIKYLIHRFDAHLSLELPLNRLTEYQQEILVAFFEWEIAGLLSQAYLNKNYDQEIKHLKNLQQLFSSTLSPENLLKIENSLKTFSKLVWMNNGKSI